jgi:hypothetical protein
MSLFLAWSFSFQAHAGMSCRQVMGGDSEAMERLLSLDGASETDILKTARQDVLGGRTLATRTVEFFNVLRWRESAQENLEVEARRRDYRRRLSENGIDIHKDLSFLMYEYKPYLSLLVSAVVNGTVNYLAYVNLGHVLFPVHVPRSRFFNPLKVPDEVLAELLEAEGAYPLARKYLWTRVGLKTDFVILQIQKALFVGVTALALLHTTQFVMDPIASLDKTSQRAVEEANKMAYHDREEKIHELENFRKFCIETHNSEKLEKVDQLIAELKNKNKVLKEELKKNN